MLTTDDILRCAILPLIISVVLALLTGRWSWGPALTLGGAFTIAFAAIEGSGVWKLPDAIDWIFYDSIGLTILAIAIDVLHARRWIQTINIAAVFAITVIGCGVMLKFNFTNHTWTAAGGMLVLLAIGVVGVISMASFSPSRKNVSHMLTAPPGDAPIASVLAMSLNAGVGGLAVMALADQTLGEAIAALGVAAIPLAVAAAIRERRCAPASGRAGVALIFGGVLAISLASAVYVSGVPCGDALLIAGACPLFWLTRFIPGRRLRSWQRGAIRLLITAIPLGVVMVLAIRAVQQNNASGDATYSTADVPADRRTIPPQSHFVLGDSTLRAQLASVPRLP